MRGIVFSSIKNKCPSQESNPEPTDPKSGALSIELLRHAQDYTRFVPRAKCGHNVSETGICRGMNGHEDAMTTSPQIK